jgi:hypothetical protein
VPIEIYIAVLAACACMVILTVLFLAAAVYLKVRADALQRNVAQLQGELSGLIQESREAVKELRLVAARATQPLDDLGAITHTARGWTERADRVVDAVGTVAEPPLFFLSKKVKTIGAFGRGLLQGLLSPKQ